MVVDVVAGVALGCLLGVCLGLLARTRQVAAARDRAVRATAALDAERAAARAVGEEATALRTALAGEFARLSGDALDRNSEQFLRLAETRLGDARRSAEAELDHRHRAIEHLLGPLGEQLGRFEAGVRRVEDERQRADAALGEQLRQLAGAHDRLERETRQLVTALRAPQSRGRWGELQLRRVVEMAGMLEHCDFEEQVTTTGDDGALRPDLVVRLPGGRNVAVDAKVPLQGFLDALEAEDDPTRRLRMAAHARQLRAHVDALSRKEYWRRVSPSPEFVVAFLPGDPLLAGALEHDPGLMEHAVAHHVLLATPTSLIALLRSVAYGWQQDALAGNARAVQELGAQLYRRLSVLGEHVAGVGRGLEGAVVAYNRAVGSLEGRVLVTARRFSALGVVGGAEELVAPPPVDEVPRPLRATGTDDDALHL